MSCSTCFPRCCKQTLTRRWKFAMTRVQVPMSIARISLWMFCFNSWMVSGLFRYTLSLRYPQTKKSKGFRSGEWAAHSIALLLLTIRSANFSCKNARAFRLVSAVSPSCWNQANSTCCRLLNTDQNCLRLGCISLCWWWPHRPRHFQTRKVRSVPEH